jgi:chorismate dehydratase
MPTQAWSMAPKLSFFHSRFASGTQHLPPHRAFVIMEKFAKETPILPYESTTLAPKKMRIGAVRYLNAKPLTHALPQTAPWAEVIFDFPSRLADRLAASDLDVAMIPSIEWLRQPNYALVSDACIACQGPVLSVKLFGRVPPKKIRSLALDEGSRTSSVLAQILLREQYEVRPEIQPLPLGADISEVSADAIVLIGDRGMAPVNGKFEFIWDLGECWTNWVGLPFVFALWIARSDIELKCLAAALAQARDEGLRHLQKIAARESPNLAISEAECLTYLRDHLHFYFGPREQAGLQRFHDLAIRHGFVKSG